MAWYVFALVDDHADRHTRNRSHWSARHPPRRARFWPSSNAAPTCRRRSSAPCSATRRSSAILLRASRRSCPCGSAPSSIRTRSKKCSASAKKTWLTASISSEDECSLRGGKSRGAEGRGAGTEDRVRGLKGPGRTVGDGLSPARGADRDPCQHPQPGGLSAQAEAALAAERYQPATPSAPESLYHLVARADARSYKGLGAELASPGKMS